MISRISPVIGRPKKGLQFSEGELEANAAYVNYHRGDKGVSGLEAAYGAAKLGRLAALKMKYDPSNLFRMNQNITSAPMSGTTRPIISVEGEGAAPAPRLT